jgi:large conductance mechanosensitive channel
VTGASHCLHIAVNGWVRTVQRHQRSASVCGIDTAEPTHGDRGAHMLKEFREFIAKGNAIDLAVGVVIGVAFGAIVTSLVNDVLMPPIGLLLGDTDFANLFAVLKEGASAGPYTTLVAAQDAGAVTLNYGLFINAIIMFLIIALVIFLVVKGVNRMKRADEEAAPDMKDCPFCGTSILESATRCPACTSELSA